MADKSIRHLSDRALPRVAFANYLNGKEGPDIEAHSETICRRLFRYYPPVHLLRHLFNLLRRTGIVAWYQPK
jgi:hypothetical protein